MTRNIFREFWFLVNTRRRLFHLFVKAENSRQLKYENIYSFIFLVSVLHASSIWLWTRGRYIVAMQRNWIEIPVRRHSAGKSWLDSSFYFPINTNRAIFCPFADHKRERSELVASKTHRKWRGARIDSISRARRTSQGIRSARSRLCSHHQHMWHQSEYSSTKLIHIGRLIKSFNCIRRYQRRSWRSCTKLRKMLTMIKLI